MHCSYASVEHFDPVQSQDGEAALREACGAQVVVLPYAKVGFDLATAVAKAYDSMPNAFGIVGSCTTAWWPGEKTVNPPIQTR